MKARRVRAGNGGSARNGALWLASAAAILPVSALALAPATPSIAAPLEFAPPRDALVLTRTLSRSLGDGKEVRTSRRYKIRFVPDRDGYRIDGRLLSVDVEAPPALAALAQLERERPDDGLFPMRVDRHGRFVSATSPAPAQQTARSAAIAARAIGESGRPAADRDTGKRFVASVADGQPRTAWPADLFNPVTRNDVQNRTIALPGGGKGHVTIETRATLFAPKGLMREFVRAVTTRMQGHARTSVETWSLEPATPET